MDLLGVTEEFTAEIAEGAEMGVTDAFTVETAKGAETRMNERRLVQRAPRIISAISAFSAVNILHWT